MLSFPSVFMHVTFPYKLVTHMLYKLQDCDFAKLFVLFKA